MRWNHRYFDRILNLDIAPRWDNGAYVCDFFIREYRERYADIQSMRQQLIFEALLAWCNEKLQYARYIEMIQTVGGSKSARLVVEQDGPPDPAFVWLLSNLRDLDGNNHFNLTQLRTFYLPLFRETDG